MSYNLNYDIAKDFKNSDYIRNLAYSIDQDKKNGNNDNLINTEKEKSIFNLYIQLGLQNGEITEKDMVECFGVVFNNSKYVSKPDDKKNAESVIQPQKENPISKKNRKKDSCTKNYHNSF